MKKIISLILVMFFIGSISIIAQNPKNGGRNNVNNKSEEAKVELSLSDSQSQEWDEIHSDYFAELQELRANENISNDDKKAKMKNLRKEKEAEINTLLNAEQIEKLKTYREEMRAGYRTGNKKGANGKSQKNRTNGITQLKEDLQLNETQLEKWDGIVISHRQVMQGLRMDDSIEEKQKKEKMQVSIAEMQAELMAILDSDQQAIYATKIDALKKRRAKQGKKSELN
jgi:hypothetical protein